MTDEGQVAVKQGAGQAIQNAGGAAPASVRAAETEAAQHKSLNDLIKESGNPEALGVKKAIDEMHKERSALIVQIKRARSRLEYKELELTAVSGFLESEKAKANHDPKKGGSLKRMKNRLEFRLSTEAKMSLAGEKEIVRRINEINAQLDDYYKVVRLERKVGFIKGDIEQYRNSLAELEKKISDMDMALDDMYRNLRRLLGVSRQKTTKAKQKPRYVQMAQQEINLEDIAVIKKKEPKETHAAQA